MPEWPDLHVLRRRLEVVVGRTIVGFALREPIVLRANEDPDALLVGRRIEGLLHRGKFLTLSLSGGVAIVVNPMLSGLLALVPHDAKVKATTCVAFLLDDGRDLRYLDDTKMGKVYLLRGSSPDSVVPGYGGLGPEAGALTWDEAAFAREAAAHRATQVRNLLLDQHFVAGIGNAYADEILWEARLHPRRRTGSLSAEELRALRQAIVAVMAWAVREVEVAMPAELGAKPRGHLRVRGSGRAKAPCPRCGAPLVLRHGGVKEMNFCPQCQPLEGSGPFGAPY